VSEGVPRFHIAEINVARLLAPLDDPRLADFVAQLDAVNAEAEGSDGFVWRLKSDGGGASSYLRPFEDDRLIVNISVWESIQTLHRFVYRARGHAAVYRARRLWFSPVATPMAMWWIEVGRIPTIEEAKERLSLLERTGPTPDAFTFKSPFPHPA
jgi:hypothetical protein